jgi:hypothetical protein
MAADLSRELVGLVLLLAPDRKRQERHEAVLLASPVTGRVGNLKLRKHSRTWNSC